MIVHAKPFERMTLNELRAEHAQWCRATAPRQWGEFVENAHACRDILAVWIARREREAAERESA